MTPIDKDPLDNLRKLSGKPVRVTPFYAGHLERDAVFFLSGDWVRPAYYPASGATAEHLACRQHAGLFDVSSIGKIEVKGAAARELLDRAAVSDIGSLAPGRGRYTCFCGDDGGILGDVIAFCVSETSFYVTAPSARVTELTSWLSGLAGPDTEVEDRTVSLAYLALQGPRARDVLAILSPDADLSNAGLPYFGCARCEVAGIPALMCRAGYTGELGYELNVSVEHGMALWHEVLAAGEPHGVIPCGGVALQTLRLEKALRQYGMEILPDRTPAEVGLEWTIGWQGRAFVGRDALLRERETAPSRRVVALHFGDLGPVPPGAAVYQNGLDVGRITSAAYGPTIKAWVGLALVAASAAAPSVRLAVEADGGSVIGTVEAAPFFDPGGLRPRR